MTDESSPPPVGDAPDDVPAGGPSAVPEAGRRSPRRGFFRRHWLLTTVVLVVGIPLLSLGLWAGMALSWNYSEGKRAGYVQKIARKGYICKTWEGTLYTDIARGFRSDSFTFTVRSDSLARVLEALSGERVAVDYEQHVNVPTTCFGETEYFVVGVERIPD